MVAREHATEGPSRSPGKRIPEKPREAPPPTRAERLIGTQRAVGNRAFGQLSTEPGLPLPADLRGLLQAGFGRDLSGVRIHPDGEGTQLARALRAQAFAAGRDVFFDSGSYRPDSNYGRWLIAHEVAHVVQQDFGRHDAGGVDVAKPGVSRAFEADADRAAAAALGRETWRPALRAAAGVQCQQTDATAPASVSAQPGVTAGPPVIFGLDTSVSPPRTYASVTFPGHSLTEIATYLYGSPDFAEQLRSENGSLPDDVPPGCALRLVTGPVSNTAHRALSAALENGTILRTHGLPTEGGRSALHAVMLHGRLVALTDSQFAGLLRGLSVWMVRKARFYRNRLNDGLEVRRWHLEGTNSLIRGISDWWGDVSVPPESTWTRPRSDAQRIIDELSAADISIDSGSMILRNLEALGAVARSLDDSESRWHRYIEGTISGAEKGAYWSEFVLDLALATGVSAISGGVAAPAVFGATTAGLASIEVTGAAATTISATAAVGVSAGFGGTLRGVLEVVKPDPHGRSAAERYISGYKMGLLQGAFGAAGSFVAPGMQNAIANRLYGVPAAGLTTAASGLTVRVLTGAALGGAGGAGTAGIENLESLTSGRMSGAEYARLVGHETLFQLAFGGTMAAVPVQGLYRRGGTRFTPFSGEPYTPKWMEVGPWAPHGQAGEPPTSASKPPVALARRGPSGLFNPLPDGSYVAFHPQNEPFAILLEGDTLTAGMLVDGEFTPIAKAASPWGESGPPPDLVNPQYAPAAPQPVSGFGGSIGGGALVRPGIIDVQAGTPLFARSLAEAYPAAQVRALESGAWRLGWPGVSSKTGITTVNRADLAYALQLSRNLPNWPGPWQGGGRLTPWTAEQFAPIGPTQFPQSGPVTVVPREFFPARGVGGELIPLAREGATAQRGVAGLELSFHPEQWGAHDRIYIRRPFALSAAMLPPLTAAGEPAGAAPAAVAMGQELNRWLRPGGFVEFRLSTPGDQAVVRAMEGQIPVAHKVEVTPGQIDRFLDRRILPDDAEQAALLREVERDLREEFSPIPRGPRIRRIIRIYKASE